jgi:hypothetical protein
MHPTGYEKKEKNQATLVQTPNMLKEGITLNMSRT